MEELENATAWPLGVVTAAGQWYSLRPCGADAQASAIALAGLGVCDLTLAGEAHLVTNAALDLGYWGMAFDQRARAGKLSNVAADAMERGERVRLTTAHFSELNLERYVDKDDFGAALMFADGDTDRPTALFVFGDYEGEGQSV